MSRAGVAFASLLAFLIADAAAQGAPGADGGPRAAPAAAPSGAQTLVIVPEGDLPPDKLFEINPTLRRLQQRNALQVVPGSPNAETLVMLVRNQDADVVGQQFPGLEIDMRRGPGSILVESTDQRDLDRARVLRDASGGPATIWRRTPLRVSPFAQVEGGRSPLAFSLPDGGEADFSTFQVDPVTERIRATQGEDRLTLTVLPSRDEFVRFSGTIVSDGRMYAVDALEDGTHAVVELPDTQTWADEPSIEDLRAGGLYVDPERLDAGSAWPYARCGQFDDGIVTIGWIADRDTYQLLSPSAGMEPARLLAVQKKLNDAIALHGVAPHQFRFVNLLNAPFRATPGYGVVADAQSFASPQREEYTNAWAVANAQHVDLFLQVVSYGQVTGNSERDCGYSPNDVSARALVVDLSCMNDERSALQHEIGHKFGGAHDRPCCPNCNLSAPYGADWRTLRPAEGTWLAMWECSAGPGQPATATSRLQSRFDQYSDPKVNQRGDAQTDMGRLIRSRIADVAGFGRCGIH